jgi:hypothetical protein
MDNTRRRRWGCSLIKPACRFVHGRPIQTHADTSQGSDVLLLTARLKPPFTHARTVVVYAYKTTRSTVLAPQWLPRKNGARMSPINCASVPDHFSCPSAVSVSPGDVVEYLVRNEPLNHVAEMSKCVDVCKSELRQNICAMVSAPLPSTHAHS